MNLTSAKFPGNRSRQRVVRLGRVFTVALCVFLLTAAPVLADPIKFNQVVQTITTSPGRPDLKINTLVSQDPKGSAPQTGPRNDSQVASKGKTKPESIISGITVTGQEQQIGVEVIEEGEVEGTICDCGEIYIAGAGIPKWPFLFLAAVPLVFINREDETPPSSTPTPTPTPPSTPSPSPPGIPEPASLLLFGTGLAAFGAGLRRRYIKTKLAGQVKAQEDE